MAGWNDTLILGPLLVLVLCRLGGLIALSPGFSHVALPMKIRLLLAAAVSLAVLPRVVGVAQVPGTLPQLLAAGLLEAMLGAAMGLAVRALFAGVELAGWHISQQMGLGLVESFDAGWGNPSESVRTLLHLLAVVIFFGIGGHRAVLTAAVDSYQSLPPAAFNEPAPMLAQVVDALEVSFMLAIRLASPVLVTLLLTAAAMGLVQRTLPQLNIFSVGMPVRVLAGLVALAAAVAAVGPLLERTLEMVINRQIG